jgi:hypothetical protein
MYVSYIMYIFPFHILAYTVNSGVVQVSVIRRTFWANALISAAIRPLGALVVSPKLRAPISLRKPRLDLAYGDTEPLPVGQTLALQGFRCLRDSRGFPSPTGSEVRRTSKEKGSTREHKSLHSRTACKPNMCMRPRIIKPQEHGVHLRWRCSLNEGLYYWRERREAREEGHT